MAEESVRITKSVSAIPGASGGILDSSVQLDAISAPTYFNHVTNGNAAGITAELRSGYSDYVAAAGYHFAQGMERARTATGTWVGAGEHLIEGEIWG